MYRVHKGRKTWRKRWPWRKLFPLKVDERFCRECSLPYHNGPMPEVVKQFIAGNVAALIYPAGNWGRAGFVVKFGRWKAPTHQFYLSEYLPAEDMRDLVKVAAQVHRYVEVRNQEQRMKYRSSRRKVC